MDRKPEAEEQNRHIPGSLIFAFIVALSLFTSDISRAEIVEGTLANVNGEIILLSELEERINLYRRLSGAGKNGSYNKETALNDLIDEKILLRYAEENNIAIKESDIDKAVENMAQRNKISIQELKSSLATQGMTIEDYRDRLGRQIIIQRLTSTEVKRTKVSDSEAKDFYNKNKELFVDPGRVKASHILFLASRERDIDSFNLAKEKITDILNQIKNGANFAKMAIKYSQDGAAPSGGDLGWFGKGKMIPAFEKVAFSLPKGSVTGPVETMFGLHLIHVTDKEEPKTIPYEKVSEAARARLENENFNRKREVWIEEIRRQSYIEILR